MLSFQLPGLIFIKTKCANALLHHCLIHRLFLVSSVYSVHHLILCFSLSNAYFGNVFCCLQKSVQGCLLG